MRSHAQIAGHPIHPMLIAFPIGFFVGAWAFDLIGRVTGNELLWAAAFYMAIAGIVGGLLAAVAGVIDYLGAIPPRSSGKKRGLLHGGLNTIVLIAFLVIAIHRKDPIVRPDGFELWLSTLAVIVLGVSGWLGGTLSYRNQIGVDHRYANAGKFRERTIENWDRPACNESEIGDGQMMLIHIGAERVVLGRCSQGIVAFSDHCTHKGGPLSDGALVGCTVQCPWHGSQFDVLTGRVVAGPAGSQIDIYKTAVRGGEVYVQPRETELPNAA